MYFERYIVLFYGYFCHISPRSLLYSCYCSAIGRGCNDLHHYSDLTRSRIVRRPALAFDTFVPPAPSVPEPVPEPVPAPAPKKNWWGGYSKESTKTIETSITEPATVNTSPSMAIAAPAGAPFLQNLASYYLAYKTDLGYKKPSWWGTPGAFLDIAHSHHPLPPSAPYGSDIYAISAGAGLSLR